MFRATSEHPREIRIQFDVRGGEPAPVRRLPAIGSASTAFPVRPDLMQPFFEYVMPCASGIGLSQEPATSSSRTRTPRS